MYCEQLIYKHWRQTIEERFPLDHRSSRRIDCVLKLNSTNIISTIINIIQCQNWFQINMQIIKCEKCIFPVELQVPSWTVRVPIGQFYFYLFLFAEWRMLILLYIYFVESMKRLSRPLPSYIRPYASDSTKTGRKQTCSNVDSINSIYWNTFEETHLCNFSRSIPLTSTQYHLRVAMEKAAICCVRHNAFEMMRMKENNYLMAAIFILKRGCVCANVVDDDR